MQKIKTFIEKNIFNIFLTFLMIHPVLDVFSNPEIIKINFSIGMIFRFLFIFFSFVYLIFIQKKNKKMNIISFICLFLFAIAYLLTKNITSLNLVLIEVKMLLKFYYFLIMCLFLYNIKDKIKFKNNNCFIYLLTIYLLLIIIPNMFFDFNSYEMTKVGEKGLFYSANEISNILAILFPIQIYSFSKSEDKKIKGLIILNILMYVITMFSIGTKVPLLAFGITMFIWFISTFVKVSKNKKIIWSSVFVVFLISVCLLIPHTNFYKNIKTHMKFYKIDNIAKVFTKYENVDNIIFSKRLSLFNKNYKIYKDSNLLQKTVGIGYLNNKNNGLLERKIVEMDYADIFISFGVVGFSMFMSVIVFLLYKKRKTKDLCLITTILLILLLGFFVGHVFCAPAVSAFVAYYLVAN